MTLWRLGELFGKKLEKVPHLKKKHEKSSIWSKLGTFLANYHVLACWSTFQQKVGKSAPFREKARKIVDLAKTCNFSSKLSRFGILVNFSAKSASFSEKPRKIVDLAKSCNFSSKLSCFSVFVNCSAKSCKKCLVG